MMNDLFSSLDDVEAGRDTASLDRFFKGVEDVMDDMAWVEKRYKKLQESNEEGKTVHNADTVKQIRARIDSDVDHVLRRVKTIKAKLEALERSTVANWSAPGSGSGSSTERARICVMSGLGKKLKDLMDDFHGLREQIQSEYKATVERRYFTITGERASEETIDELISSGESETLLLKAIERGHIIMDAVSEIHERHNAVKETEKNLTELHRVFLDMAALVEAQGHHVNDIECHVARASSFVRREADSLSHVVRQQSSGKRTCLAVAVALGAVVVLVLLFPLLTRFLGK